MSDIHGDRTPTESDGIPEAPDGMSGVDTGTAPWGVSGEGDARDGDAADAGGERTPPEHIEGADPQEDDRAR